MGWSYNSASYLSLQTSGALYLQQATLVSNSVTSYIS